MSVAVTGATGHLGSNLVRALLADGQHVRAVVRRQTPQITQLGIEVASADVSDRAALRRAFEGVEVVYHLAACISVAGSQGGLVERVNIDGARNAAEAALSAGVRRFVHFSSVHAFDMTDSSRVVDEQSVRAGPGRPAYDQSKAAGESAVRNVVARGLDAVILHPTGCIGPHDFAPSAMGQVLIDLYHRRLPALVDGGFHWVDTRDVAAAAMSAAEHGRTSESYIVSGQWQSLSKVASLAAKATGVAPPRFTVPMWLAEFGVPAVTALHGVLGLEAPYTREGLEALRSSRQLSVDKAERELRFEPRPLQQTIEDTFVWFRQTGRLDR